MYYHPCIYRQIVFQLFLPQTGTHSQLCCRISTVSVNEAIKKNMESITSETNLCFWWKKSWLLKTQYKIRFSSPIKKLIYRPLCFIFAKFNRPFPHSNKQWHRVEVGVDKNTVNVWKCPPQPRSGAFVRTHLSEMRERSIPAKISNNKARCLTLSLRRMLIALSTLRRWILKMELYFSG